MVQEIQIEKRLFNVSEYYKMSDSGILKEGAKVELINGEIINMSPIKSFHAGKVNALARKLFKDLGVEASICIQNPVHLSDFSEPEPDLTIAKYRQDEYENHHPRPADIYFLIEVSDSTINFDRKVKAALYAAAGISEYWIINLQEQQIEVFTKIQNGEYFMINIAKKGDSISAKEVDFTLEVSLLFP